MTLMQNLKMSALVALVRFDKGPMATISIEAGCDRIENTSSYIYRYSTVEAEYVVVFVAAQVPKIGDSIVDGVHVPLVGYKINNDPGFQADKCYSDY